MWTLLIFVLLCAIGLLLWLHYRQEQAWEQEMAAWEAEGSGIPAPQGGWLAGLLAALSMCGGSRKKAVERLRVITGKNRTHADPAYKTEEESSRTPVSERPLPELPEKEARPAFPDFQPYPQAAAIGRHGRARLSNVPEPEIVPFEDHVPSGYQSHIVAGKEWTEITLEEAERSLAEAMLQEAAEQKAVQSASKPGFVPDDFNRETLQLRSSSHALEGLSVIDLNDPALKRTRERVRAEADGIRIPPAAAPKIEYTQTALRMLENERHGAWQQSRAVKNEIGVADIENNLLRRRASSRRHTVPNHLRSTEPQIIPDAEVYANLAQTGSPFNRRVRPLRRVDTRMRESVLPDAARADNLAAKVQPHKPFVQNKPKQTPIPVHPPVRMKETPPVPFISRPAAPDATVVEPPPVPPTPPVAIDIPEPPLFNPPPVVILPEVSAHVSDKPLRSIHDYLISESADHEAGSEAPIAETVQAVSAQALADGQTPEDWARDDAESLEAGRIGADSVAATWPSETESEGAETDFDTESGNNEAADGDESVSDTAGINLPGLDLLLPPQFDPSATQTEESLLENSITIEEKLAEFKVKVKVVDSYSGPVITRYEIEPDVGVRGNAVMNLEKDLARSLGVASIRVVETIPGKTCMGLELPNPKRQMIRLSEIFNSPAFTESKSKLTLALGQDITGEPVVTDLAKAPHLLVAGTTGSGKSVGVNAMILSMLFKATPEDVRMIMIDPKMLELSIYEGIPHLLAPVVTDMKLAANALNWCVNEMEKRYRLMSHMGVRNLASFNQKIAEAAARGEKPVNPFTLTPDNPEPLEKLPFIVVVVDELADLMMTAGKKIEELIARLAQKARAAGIHLILATQRPSVDVITGLIKANIPTRIAFQVSSKIDSRTILDQMGAENLLGQGDMLFLPPGTGYPQRVHGAFASDGEVHQVVEYLKQFGEPDYIDEICAGGVSDELPGMNGNRSEGESDPLYDEAVAHVVKTRKASISGVQRVLRIGYNRAARLIDQMEEDGIVSAAETNGNRTVLAPPGSHLD